MPKSLAEQIQRHLNHHYDNNRLKWLEADFKDEGVREEDKDDDFGEGKSAKDDPSATATELANDDDYLNVLPRQIKRNVRNIKLFIPH